MKIKRNKIILIAFFAIFLVAGFGLGKVEKARAASCVCTDSNNNPMPATASDQPDQASCVLKCINTPNTNINGVVTFNGQSNASTQVTANGDVVSPPSAGYQQSSSDICTWGDWFSSNFFNCILITILRFMAMLLTAAVTLFALVIDTSVFDAIVRNPVIYQMWAFVRDILNVAFILALLFSAFCTIFQVDKYSYRAILKTLIIMALLVNFSFPIARFIIDFANVIMYFFVQALGISKSGIWANFAQNDAVANIVASKPDAGAAYLIAAIIFIFVLAVTIFMVSILLLIRVVALAILIIFSSVAFVGSIVPFLSSQASKWWDALFKYSFFGPIMIFMVYVALEMMGKITTLQQKFNTVAAQNISDGSSVIGSIAFFMIPVVLLWAGMNFAQSMSIAGASAVVGRGRKFMGSVGRWTYRAPGRGAGGFQRRAGSLERQDRDGISGKKRVGLDLKRPPKEKPLLQLDWASRELWKKI